MSFYLQTYTSRYSRPSESRMVKECTQVKALPSPIQEVASKALKTENIAPRPASQPISIPKKRDTVSQSADLTQRNAVLLVQKNPLPQEEKHSPITPFLDHLSSLSLKTPRQDMSSELQQDCFADFQDIIDKTVKSPSYSPIEMTRENREASQTKAKVLPFLDLGAPALTPIYPLKKSNRFLSDEWPASRISLLPKP